MFDVAVEYKAHIEYYASLAFDVLIFLTVYISNRFQPP